MILISAIALSEAVNGSSLRQVFGTVILIYLYVFKRKLIGFLGLKKGLRRPFLLSSMYRLVYSLACFVKKLAALL